jgi:hypothetical protein
VLFLLHFVLVDFAPAARIRELRNVRNDSATSITMESEQSDFKMPKGRMSAPVDPAKDQVATTRRVLREMNDQAERAIDPQAAASTPMTPKK